LLPGLVENGGCSATQAQLTAIAAAAFPSLTDADVSSGPCHSHFNGNFGSLRILALDGSNDRTCIGGPNEGGLCLSETDCPGAAACENGAPFILGGGQNTVFSSCGDNVVNGTDQCDGLDSLACPGRCLPPTSALACQCSLCGSAPDPACTPPALNGKAPLKIVNHVDDDKDALIWRWTEGEIDAAAFGSPTVDTTFQVCVYDETSLVATAIIPGGGLCGDPQHPKGCWKDTSNGFKFKNGALLPMGVKTLKLKAGEGTLASIKLTAKGDLVEVPSDFPLDVPVTVQMKNSANATCWDAVYDKNVTQNKAGDPQSKFRAKAD
jgi:hypothetical protein